MKQTIYVLFALMISLTTAQAAQTDWMGKNATLAFVKANMSAQNPNFYPTKIECKQKSRASNPGHMEIRFTYKPMPTPKPFHKYNWVLDRASQLEKRVSKLRRSDRLDLKYRMIDKDTYVASDGSKWGCALAYR